MKKNILVASIVAAIALSVGVSSYANHDDFGPGFGFGPEMRGEFGTGVHGTGGLMRGEHAFGKQGDSMGKKGLDKKQDDRGGMMSDAMKVAIQANDYDAFVKAWNDQQSKITVPSKEEFVKRVAFYTAHQAVEAAVIANNYEAFKIALANMPKPTDKDGKELPNVKTPTIPTAEQFALQVKKAQSHQAVEAAVIANNYEAFTTALANMPKPTDKDGKELTNFKTPPVPTAEEFAKRVEQKKKQLTIENTLKTNDYTAFVAVWTAQKPTVPTKEEFAKIVAKKDEIKQNKKEFQKDKKHLQKLLKQKKVKYNQSTK